MRLLDKSSLVLIKSASSKPQTLYICSNGRWLHCNHLLEEVNVLKHSLTLTVYLEIKVKITVVPSLHPITTTFPQEMDRSRKKHMINKGNVQVPWLPCDWQVNRKQLCIWPKQLLHASRVSSKYDQFFSSIWKGVAEPGQCDRNNPFFLGSSWVEELF